MSIETTVAKNFRRIKKLRSQAGYAEGGNCLETSISLGVLLARHGITVLLIEGIVRETKHFWLEIDGEILDPTKNQFPGLRKFEYPQGEKTGIDFEEMAILLGFI